VASPIPITGGAETGVGLQRGDSSRVGSFLVCEEGGIGFFALTTRGEELLDPDGGSAEISCDSREKRPLAEPSREARETSRREHLTYRM